MTNEYGAKLDRAGYAPSIMQAPQRMNCCYLCGMPAGGEKMDRHEPWGAANRQKSMRLGLWVMLHHWGCHEGPGGVHTDGDAARRLRADAQRAAILAYGWTYEKWIEEFGKSELTEEECAKLLAGPGADTSTGAARHLPLEGKADPSAPLRFAQNDTRGAGRARTVGDIIHEYWPDHATTTAPTRRSAFRVLDVPDLPY